jgi:hypothetical protein
MEGRDRGVRAGGPPRPRAEGDSARPRRRIGESGRATPAPRRAPRPRPTLRCRGVSSHRLQTALAELLAADLSSLDLAAMMMDGVLRLAHLRARDGSRHRRDPAPVAAGGGTRGKALRRAVREVFDHPVIRPTAHAGPHAALDHQHRVNDLYLP